MPIPSEEEIIQEQKRQAQIYFQNKKYKEELDEINFILKDPNFGIFDYSQTEAHALEKAFQDFDDGSLASFYNTKDNKKTYEDLLKHHIKYQNNLDSLDNIVSHLEKIQQTNSAIPDSFLLTFKTLLQEIKIDIQQAPEKIKEQIPESRSYLQKYTYIGYFLKGYLLEEEGFNFLQKNIPTGYKVINMANVEMARLDIFGESLGGNSTVKARSDFGIIKEDIADSIQMEWFLNGEKISGTFSQFIDFCNSKLNGKGTTISIPDPETAKIIRNKMLGIQAKSNLGTINFLKKNKTTNSRSISVGMVMNKTGNFAQYTLFLLNRLMDFKGPYAAHLQDTNEIYDKYFNYALSKFLTKIIGEENNIMLTRYGFQSVYDFLIDSFNRGQYFRAANRVHVRYADKSIPVHLK